MTERSSSRRHIRVQDLDIDIRSEEVRRNGEPVRMPPQAFRVLTCLARRLGKLVSREELREALWGDDVHVDFDRSLNFSVHQLRKALGDTGEVPVYIETLPRRGYRLRAVRSKAVESVVVIVLPFENLTGDGDQDYLVDGLTDEIITTLGRLHPERLGVIGRTTALQCSGSSRGLLEMVDELNVTHVVEGLTVMSGWIRLRAKRPTEALPILRDAINLQPDNALGHLFLAWCHLERGDDTAGDALEEALKRHGDSPSVLSYGSFLIAELGHRDRCRSLLRRLREVARTNYVDPYYLAVAHAGLGATDRAFSLLERAVEEKTGAVPKIGIDRFVDPLRSDPRFPLLLDRVGVIPFESSPE